MSGHVRGYGVWLAILLGCQGDDGGAAPSASVDGAVGPDAGAEDAAAGSRDADEAVESAPDAAASAPDAAASAPDAAASASDAAASSQDASRSPETESDASVEHVACEPDDSAPVPARDSYGQWVKVELPGTMCSDGSQYKFFVNFSETRNDLVVMFEPGGACWDYDTCAAGGRRGAPNPRGIPDDHVAQFQHAYPHAGGMFGEDGAVADWNKVFLPYCTGDVHIGSRVATYRSESGEDELVYRHVGHDNVLEVVGWLDETFPVVPRLLVTGCSAGGVGAFVNYPVFRSGMAGIQCGHLLNDSGPIFPSDGPSALLHDKVTEAFDTSAVLDRIGDDLGQDAVERVREDFGELNLVLADAYPHDRLSVTLFQRDLSYSLYSYDTFYDQPPYETIVDYWETDVAALAAMYDTRPNLAYYMPFFRPDNCSHCVSIIPLDRLSELLAGDITPWRGTAIETQDMTAPAFIDQLLDEDVPLQSYFERSSDDGAFTEAQIAACRE